MFHEVRIVMPDGRFLGAEQFDNGFGVAYLSACPATRFSAAASSHIEVSMGGIIISHDKTIEHLGVGDGVVCFEFSKRWVISPKQ